MIALLISLVASAQSDPQPVHGWLQLEAGRDTQRGWIGATFPVIPEVTVAVGAAATDAWSELQLGSTLEIGVLYLMPLVGPDYSYETDSFGIGAQWYAVVELPGLPVYYEAWTRFGVHTPFGAEPDSWHLRRQLLYTASPALAAGLQIEGRGQPFGPLASVPIGLRMTAGTPRHFGFGAFLGFETAAANKELTMVPPIGLMGRVTADFSW